MRSHIVNWRWHYYIHITFSDLCTFQTNLHIALLFFRPSCLLSSGQIFTVFDRTYGMRIVWPLGLFKGFAYHFLILLIFITEHIFVINLSILISKTKSESSCWWCLLRLKYFAVSQISLIEGSKFMFVFNELSLSPSHFANLTKW